MPDVFFYLSLVAFLARLIQGLAGFVSVLLSLTLLGALGVFTLARVL